MKTNRDRPLVMIADRDALERAQLKAVLKLKGFNVIEASNGPEAISLAMRHFLLKDLECLVVVYDPKAPYGSSPTR